VRDGLVNRLYFTELVISPDSPLVGKTLAESKLGSDLGLNVLRIVRGNRRFLVPVASTRLEADDTLLVEGLRDEVLEVRSVPGLTIKPEYRFSSEAIDTEDIQLVEVLLLPGSPLIGRTLKSQRFRDRYGAQVLAVVHHDRIGRHRPGLKDLRFHVGDILLLQGDREQLAGLGTHIGFDVLNEVQDILPDNRKQTLSVIIFLAAILLAAFNILPLVVAILGGALLVFLTRCITPQEAYLSINWQIIILIGSMLGAGLAMEHTGTAAFLAGSIVRVVGTANPLWLLTGFFFLTILLTQPMSNQAAAVVVLPIAIGTALQIGLNPRTFAVMIAVAASTSYLTPLEPACLMVYGPGQYRFTDFLRVGLPLTLLIYLVAVILVPLIWPL
jgi:di/tricarboxylate transporter